MIITHSCSETRRLRLRARRGTVLSSYDNWRAVLSVRLAGVCESIQRDLMMKAKIICHCIYFLLAVQKVKSEQSSSFLCWMLNERRQKQWVSAGFWVFFWVPFHSLLVKAITRLQFCFFSSWLQKAKEHIDLSKAKTGASKNLYGEISSLMKPMDFYQMTSSPCSVR